MDWSEYFSYDGATGVLTWKVKRPGPQTAVGKEVGSICGDGRYRSVVLKHRRYYVHRVIWELVCGPIPEGMCIDHIDGDGLNNVWDNLRLTTLSGNQRNRRIGKNNRLGVPGLIQTRSGFAVYCAGGYVGHFRSFERAAEARKQAEVRNGYHPNNGRNCNANS